MSRSRIGPTLAGLWLTGCVTAQPVEGPDGARRYFIRCDGPGVPINACLAKAEDACFPYGYRLVEVSSRTTGDAGATWVEDVDPPARPGERPQRYVVAECDG